MPKTSSFRRPTLSIEAQRGINGVLFIAWRPGTAQCFVDRKSLLRWVNWPSKTPTGDELREWLDSLEPSPAESAHVADANVAGSFDPLAHGLDESDPQFQTRTII